MAADLSKYSSSGNPENPLPVFLNLAAGGSESVIPALEKESRIDLHRLSPQELSQAIAREVANGKDRILVCGGDGTLRLAASHLAGKTTELAILPGGTLNHFARQLGIPNNPEKALELALRGRARPTAAGRVNDQVFLNTSSVGAYVLFVQSRMQYEQQIGYHSASLLAGLGRLFRFRSGRIDLNGSRLRSPLVFVGVHERGVKFPLLGQKKPDGREGLHLIAIRSRGRLESFRIAFNAMILGVDPMQKEERIENRVMEKLEIRFPKGGRKRLVALDGELVHLQVPLHYRYQPAALNVVTPQTKDEAP